MLGWSFSEKPEKRLEFDKCFGMLGVVFDFSETAAGKVILKNREDRLDSFKAVAEAAIAKGSMSQAETASLQGRFVQGEAQLFGRVSAS